MDLKQTQYNDPENQITPCKINNIIKRKINWYILNKMNYMFISINKIK